MGADSAAARPDEGGATAARIAADMHSQRMRTGAPAVSAADIAAAALDGKLRS